MPLRKPPIVELWVEFTFEPMAAPPVEPTLKFLKEYADEYPELEIGREDQLSFEKVPSSRRENELVRMVRSVELKHLRAHDGQGSKWLHVTKNEMATNFLRLGDNYPGFEKVCDEVMAKFRRYVEIVAPVRLVQAAIHYVDLISVPPDESGQISLQDYFMLGVDLPTDPFGSQIAFTGASTVVPQDGTGPLEIRLQSEATPERRMRFRMDWHKVCPYHNDIDPDLVSSMLTTAHESVMKCFKAAFTPLAWQLFEPYH